MTLRMLAAALWLAAAGVAGAQPFPLRPSAAVATPGLSCDDAGNESPEAHERRVLRSAPGVKRVSAHVLQLSTPYGVRRLADRRPYREELSGFHWFYCGYVAALHAHLIGMDDEDLFSGKLLFDRGGALLDAGRTVYPSPDGTLFLAAAQRDGRALEDWRLSDLSGATLWSGESGATEAGVVRVEYQDPRWISRDALRVTAVCGDRDGTRGEATLVREGRSWRWRSDLQCRG